MADETTLASVYAARDNYANSLGVVSPDVIAPIINPAFMGGPRWPDLRQAWKTIRRGSHTIILSDGLSDPFDDETEPDTGFELEILVETDDTLDDPIQSTWLFQLAYEVSQQCADHGGVRELVDELGLLSLEIPDADTLPPAATTDGIAGILLGLAPPDYPTQFDLPAGTVRVITAKLLWPTELDFIITNGKTGRETLAERFTADSTHHMSSLHRQPAA